jgi:Ran GTPase-activating protein (RanGAP) involved in mRNA processing and transport
VTPQKTRSWTSISLEAIYEGLDACFTSFGTPSHAHQAATTRLCLGNNSITATGVDVLLETMAQNSNHITDLDLQYNYIWNEGAILLARSLGNNALANLTRLSLNQCGIGDDGFIALMSALERKTSLLKLDLRQDSPVFSEQAFLALAERLPEIKVLQYVDLSWCTGLASVIPLLLEGLRKNTSLFPIQVANCAPSSVRIDN